MSESTVAIVGSGIAGSLIAHLLTDSGYDVEVFEKGPDYPYPHSPQFKEQVHYLYDNPAYQVPPDLKNHTCSRGYQGDLETERHHGRGRLVHEVGSPHDPHDPR